MRASSTPLARVSHDSAATAAGWSADLRLRFERRAGRCVLAAREHGGPLRVQRPLYQEGDAVCQVIVIHPPGGIVAGDRLALDITACTEAHALLTTPGASRWYRSIGPEAAQRVELRLEAQAVLEWMPQESIVFDGARVDQHLRVDLGEAARYIGWEITCFGRTASGERFEHGLMRQRTQVYRGLRPLFVEQAQLEGGSTLLDSKAGLAGRPVSALMVAAGYEAAGELLQAMRAAPVTGDDLAGVTILPEVTIARYLGRSAQAARDYFTALWQLLRPQMLGREAVVPRIWSC